MTVKAFDIPFASSGDVAPVPDAPPGDGTVNYTQGFDVNYELAYSNPSALDVPREQFNQIMLDVTGAIQQIQQNGVPLYFSILSPYALYAIVLYSDGHIYQSTVADNSSTPGSSATWKIINPSSPVGFAYSTFTGYSTTQTLTAANLGSVIGLFGAGTYTVTLPLASACPMGSTLTLFSYAPAITVASQGSENIEFGNNASATSFAMATGNNVVLFTDGTSWFMIGGNTQAVYGFANLSAASGYEQSPSGTIRQWGTFTTSTSGYTNWSFPKPFPNAVFQVGGTLNASTLVNFSVNVDLAAATTSHIPVASVTTAGSASYVAETLSMWAIGN